jgi:2-polyprenyl-6-methoxyphenol hydroxylase-like FAD-dependent oxidoreductase
VLSRALLEEAESLASVEIRTGVSVLDVQISDDCVELETSQGPVRGRFLVGADGLLSRVRSLVGLAGPRGERRRFGTNQHFAIAPWSPFVDVHWGDGVEAYITPVAPDQVGVAMLWDIWSGPPKPAGPAIMKTLLARFPILDERLRDATPIDVAASCGSLANSATAVVRDRMVLIGDATGYLDAITGEGLSLAFEESVALGEILPPLLASDRLAAPHLAPYARAHHRITAPYYRFTGLVLALGRFPWLVERLVGMLGRHESLFTSFLDVNMGRAGLASLGPTGWARVIWAFCFPPPHRSGQVHPDPAARS